MRDYEASDSWFPHCQHGFCAAFSESNVVCLELCILCGSQPRGEYVDGSGSKSDILVNSYKASFTSVIEHSVSSTPRSLRYLSLDCSTRVEPAWKRDWLSPEYRQVTEVQHNIQWRVLRGKAPSKVAELLEVEKGERIAAYIRSMHYEEIMLDKLEG